jgi:hypothetical protein
MNIHPGCGSLLAALALTLLPDAAQAYHLLTKSGACPNGFVFAADAPLATNIANVSATDAPGLVKAVMEVASRISNVGGQSFDYAPFAIVSDPFAIGDADGENEVGLADLSGTGAGGMGPTIVDLATCTIVEANVLLAQSTIWRWFVPARYGEDYFNSTSVSGGERYGREVILHELGHNLSLAHTTDSYDFMNAGSATTHARPWANRVDEKRVEPLPDMRRALRALYGNAVAEKDVAALVTWFDDTTGASPAPQRLLCRPSTGVGFSVGLFDDTCGVDAAGLPGSSTMCSGDSLYTRVAIPNYGTDDMAVDIELWFSTDATLDRSGGTDLQSTTVVPITVGSGSSARRGLTFWVPAGLVRGASYYPIVFINSGAEYGLEESQDNNWIPLRSPVSIDPLCP